MTEKTDLPALIARVRELDAAATKGPWRVGSVETWHVFSPSTHAEAMGPERVLLRLNEHFPHAADGALIAAYRTAAPLLADECSRLQERVRVLEAALRPFADRAADYDRPVDDPGYPIEPDYRPKEQRTRRLLIGDLRAARAALEGIDVE